MEEYFTGVIEDPRPLKEKKKDWNAKELLSGGEAFDWEEKTKWKSYTERNQKRTSSCVPQSVSKLLEINNKNETKTTVVFSATKPYADRTNSGAGSWLQEMLKYAVEGKYTTEELLESQNLDSDEQMQEIAKTWNSEMEKVAINFAGKSYLNVDTTIDDIAFWQNQGYGVSILIYADLDEWKLEYPTVKRKVNISKAPIRHAIAVVDSGLIDGEKYLKIEDSAHFGGISERFLSEAFIKERCFGAGMIFDKPNEKPEELIHTFKKIMRLGERSTEVKFLQERLKVEGLFPSHIPSSGYYGEITRQAVEKFQIKYKVASDWELSIVKGRIVGLKTISVLNL